MGVPIGSDWQDKPADDPVFGLYRTCGFFSEGEIELLSSVARQFRGTWLEIGAHTGWCTSVLVGHQIEVVAVEPMFSAGGWEQRFRDNVGAPEGLVSPWGVTSETYFKCRTLGQSFDGCLIDGDHEAPAPLNDAKGCFERLNERGVIILHDFRGGPVWDATKWLIDQGMNFRLYPSVHMIAVCWRGEFDPPPDIQEGDVDWAKHWGLPEWMR